MAAEAVAIPAGYALVPIEPTEEMIAVGVGKGDADFYGDALVKAEVRSDYQAMIAAAPPSFDTRFSRKKADGSTCRRRTTSASRATPRLRASST
ncbi:hypothetical protein [Burkholderia thailandensis]|uniref:hypothetical protein n=1 Tax=Burkholderia thailandensis TaxID=57975 RepID=UPI001643905D|nr:hypothetical protein [Burkholderia thailandensis]